MKKISAIIAAVVLVAVVIVFAGCQKQEAPKPAMQSAVTSSATMSAPTSTAPMAMPEKK